MFDFLLDSTLRTIALGTATLGLVSGMLGTFAVLRRQSLLGDAMSHASLPGIAAAFMLTGSKASLVLVLGAATAGWIGTLVVMGITRSTRVKDDAALGIVLASFFGLGLVMLTFIQRRPDAAQAGLNRFLFGQAATLLVSDVVVMVGLGAVVLAVLALFWKEFALLTFDPDLAHTLGLPVRRLDVLLTTLIVLAIVIGLQAVGVVLMSAAIVAPAAAARQWTDRLGRMTLLAGLFGALAGVSGALVSAAIPRMPTGPTVVVMDSIIVIVSLLVAPERGLVWRAVRFRQQRQRLVDAMHDPSWSPMASGHDEGATTLAPPARGRDADHGERS